MRFDPSIVTVKQSSIVRSKKYLTLKENGDQILLKIILRNFKTRQRPDVLGQIDVLLTLKSMLKQSLRDRGGEGREGEGERKGKGKQCIMARCGSTEYQRYLKTMRGAFQCTVNRQQKRATCFATFMQNVLKINVERFITHVQTCFAVNKGCRKLREY